MRDLRSVQGIGKREFVMLALAQQNVDGARWPGDEAATTPVAQVRLDWGGWIADCPFCPGAALVDWDEPLHFCLSCHNAAAGHRWVEVALPTPEQRHEVEAWLTALPEQHQHWRQGDDYRAGPVEPTTVEQATLDLAHNAGIERDRQARRAEVLTLALSEERRHTLAVINLVERMKREAELRKQLNRELQDQIDAFNQHGHGEN